MWLLGGEKRKLQEKMNNSHMPQSAQYHRMFAGNDRHVVKDLVVITLIFIGLVLFAQLALEMAKSIDVNILGRSGFTPVKHAAGAIALCLMIPYSMFLQYMFYGLPGRTLHSVAGYFRFDIFGRCLVVFGPILLILTSITSFLVPGAASDWSAADLIAFFVIGMILTPLAAAGEEYGIRGLMFRIVGGWTRDPRSGAILGIVLTTVLFSVAHGAFDPYLLASYLMLFSTLAIITWRTGGLEVAIVLHGVYNVSFLVLATALHADLGGALGSRSDASGTMANLLPGAGLIGIAAFVCWTTRRTGPAETPSLASSTDARSG